MDIDLREGEEPAEGGAGDEDEQQGEVAAPQRSATGARGGSGSAPARPIEWTVPGNWILHEDIMLGVDVLKLDSLAVHGQIRPLSTLLVDERVADMTRNPPTLAVRALVWQERAGGVLLYPVYTN